MPNVLSNSEPVFVVGMNGSGTSMLLDCLDSHPELYGFRYFSDKKLLGLEDIAGSALDDLGYETNNSTGDKEPNLTLRRLWLCKDYIKLGIAEFRNILPGRGKKSWRFFFEKIIRSIRQRTTTKY